MKKSAQAAQRFCNGHSCAQAILTSYGEKYGLDSKTAMKLTTGLAGGMGRMGHTCGAVTGGILVIGLEKSSGLPDDHDSKEATFAAVQSFSDQFERKHNSLLCRDLLGCDIGKAEGYKKAREDKLFKNRCPHFVQAAVEILEQMFER